MEFDDDEVVAVPLGDDLLDMADAPAAFGEHAPAGQMIEIYCRHAHAPGIVPTTRSRSQTSQAKILVRRTSMSTSVSAPMSRTLFHAIRCGRAWGLSLSLAASRGYPPPGPGAKPARQRDRAEFDGNDLGRLARP
jgi:hypothetical protein